MMPEHFKTAFYANFNEKALQWADNKKKEAQSPPKKFNTMGQAQPQYSRLPKIFDRVLPPENSGFVNHSNLSDFLRAESQSNLHGGCQSKTISKGL